MCVTNMWIYKKAFNEAKLNCNEILISYSLLIEF